MACETCILDIHICGGCRSEFTDICKFIQHKKECYLSVTRCQRQLAELMPAAGQCNQHLHSDGLELQLPVSDFQSEPYSQSSAASDNLESADQATEQVSLPCSQTEADQLLPDCATGRDQFSYALNSALVSEHKNLDTATAYTYPWSADPETVDEPVSINAEHGVSENEIMLVTDSVLRRKHSMKSESSVDDSRNHVDIVADNIAVYVMSPKSFASSVRTRPKFSLDSRSKPLSEFSTGSLWTDSQSDSDQQNHVLDALAGVVTSSSTNSKRSLVSFDAGEQHQDLMFVPHDSTGIQIAGSCFYSDTELALGSNTSTPCPEDLEVGQISAAMFGKKNQPEYFKMAFSVGPSQVINTTTELAQDHCRTSFQNSTSSISQSDLCDKMLMDDIDGVQEYIRENTASAPIIKVKKSLDVLGRRRISLEKRERLQGVSDDLLSSPVKYTPPNSAISQGLGLGEKTVAQVGSGNLTSAQVPPVKPAELTSLTRPVLIGYKALFTSPSSGGHRLTPTHTEPSVCSIQGISSLKRQLFARDLVSKSVEYKNISGSVVSLDKPSDVPHSASALVSEGNKSICPSQRDQESSQKKDVELLSNRVSLENSELSNINDSNDILTQSTIINPAPNTQKVSLAKMSMTVSTDVPYEHQPATSFGEQLGAAASFSEQFSTVTNFSEQLSVLNSNAHLQNVASIQIMDNLNDVQTCIGDVSSGDFHMASSSKNAMAENVDSQKSIPLTCAENTSFVMVYKNNDGSIIMVPKMHYRNNQHKNSQHAAEIFFSDKDIETKVELSVQNLGQNNNQQQSSESDIRLSAVSNDSSQCVSKHYYIQNMGVDLPDQSNFVPSSILSNSDALCSVSQVKNISPNSTQHLSNIQNEVPAQKLQISNNRLIKQVSSEKEKYIIKPRKTDGLTKTSGASLDQLNRAATRKVQSPSVKDHLVGGILEQDDEFKKTRAFTCKFDKCRYTTSLYKDFQRHYRRHTGEKPYQCMECGKSFNRSDKLKIHERRHTGSKPFQCQLCDYAAIEGGSLKKHMRIHTDERPFKCQICSYASRNSSQLIVHLRTHTGDSPFHCGKCPARFKINSDLKRHMRIHTGEKPFQCEKCDYKSSNKGNLKTHMKINHLKENEIHCPTCKFVTSSRKRLREHEKMHSVQVVKCSQCEYTCANFGQLRSHVTVHNSTKPYKCSFCSYSSKQNGNLKKHVQNMHLYKIRGKSKNCASSAENVLNLQGTRRENLLLPVTEEQNVRKRRCTTGCRKLHMCEKCGSAFVREDSLRCHMKQHNTEGTGSSPLEKSESYIQAQKLNADSDKSSATDPSSQAFYSNQGIQQIVAAASKIYEENYGLTNSKNKMASENAISFDSNCPTSVVSSECSVKNNQSDAVNCSSNSSSAAANDIEMCKRLALLQVPWERKSCALVVAASNKESHAYSHFNGDPSSSSSAVHSKSQILPPKSKIFTTKCGKVNKLPSSNKGFINSSPKRQASKQHGPHLTKRDKCEMLPAVSSSLLNKSYQIVSQSTVTSHQLHGGQSAVANYLQQSNPSIITAHFQQSNQSTVTTEHSQSSQPAVHVQQAETSSGSSAELCLVPGPEATHFLTQQDPGSNAADSFYKIHLLPPVEASQITSVSQVSQEFPLPLGGMHIQLQPSRHIQIVMPDTTVSEAAPVTCGQDEALVPQQQIFLQVQDGTKRSQVFTVPAGNLNTLQTTCQVVPHILSHFAPRPNGQVGITANSHLAAVAGTQRILVQPAQLVDGVKTLVSGGVDVASDLVHETVGAKVELEMAACI